MNTKQRTSERGQALVLIVLAAIVIWLLTVAIGLPLGLLTARSTLFQSTFGLLALGFQALPSVCWVPLALLNFQRPR